LVCSSTDIDERKKAEQKLQQENVAFARRSTRLRCSEENCWHIEVSESVLSRIAKVAPTAPTVLITGETGTGKELIARAVHKTISKDLLVRSLV